MVRSGLQERLPVNSILVSEAQSISPSVACLSLNAGYLQGAYFEGKDIASKVAECILNGGCLGLEHVEQVKNAHPYDIN